MGSVVPIIGFIFAVVIIFLVKYTKKSRDTFAAAGNIALEAFSQIKIVSSFGSEENEVNRYKTKLKKAKKYDLIIGCLIGVGFGILMFIIYSSYFILFRFGTRYIYEGSMNAGQVYKVFLCLISGTGSLTGLSGTISMIAQSTAAASTVFNIIDRTPKIRNDIGEKPDKNLKGDIEFRNVNFSYPSRSEVQVLKNVSFKCQSGNTIAIVGASGSGKSTIIQLLERFYDKESGEILIDGKPIEEYNIPWLRSQYGIVSQNPVLFEGTIADNIKCTKPNATKKEIEEVAKSACIHEFIKSLNDGYDTNINERGLNLSGGQKQRICIARAILNNPNILLLDEATSALDNKSEKIVQNALNSVGYKRTTIIVAHRLSTIKNADTIIVMEKGEIIETGTHDELMKKKGAYYGLIKNQEMNLISSSSHTDNRIKRNTLNSAIESIPSIDTENIDINKDKDNKQKQKEEEEFAHVRVFKKMHWKRYLKYNKNYWLPLVIGIIGTIIDSTVQPVYSYIYSGALSSFTEVGTKLLENGLFWSKMFIVLGIVNFTSCILQNCGLSTATALLGYKLRSGMFNSMIHQEMAYFDQNKVADLNDDVIKQTRSSNNSGSLTSKLSLEVDLMKTFNNDLANLGKFIITFILCITISYINSFKLALIISIILPICVLSIYMGMKSIRNKNELIRSTFVDSSTVVSEIFTNIKTVLELNQQEKYIDKYNYSLYKPQRNLEHKYLVNNIWSAFTNISHFIASLVGYYFTAKFIENGTTEFERAYTCIKAFDIAISSLVGVSGIAPTYDKAVEAFGHILEILDRKSEINSSEKSGIIKIYEYFKGNLAIKDIKFAYPSRPNNIVLDFDEKNNNKFEIPYGKKCGIVGSSGCGKSTIIALILRWYDPIRGGIFIDDINNKDYNLKWLREQMSIVTQEAYLFNVSIRENILYGKPEATQKEIEEAAKKANIHDFIVSLPEGYDTVIGGSGTSKMSGGQKQRVAIARAIIRNPKILLLDEATSALDAESELLVQKALDEFSNGRTTIAIAHRLSTLKNYDYLLVIKEGKIEEMGTPDELLEKKGEYYSMIE
ncbi:P-loop containing nucleoside triphosphate hydrolase protein, partial [Anaeromyces robustus]